MSKRARRERTPNLPPEAFNVPKASATPAKPAPSEALAAAPTTAPTTAPARKQTVPAVDWQREYGEVLGDLRQTFIIFAGLVLLMIALSFIIR